MTPHLMLGLVMMVIWGLFSRVMYVLVNIWYGSPTVLNKRTIKTLVVLGSGGHTGEMFKLSKSLLPERYTPLIYVVADTDKLSRARLEETFNKEHNARMLNRKAEPTINRSENTETGYNLRERKPSQKAEEIKISSQSESQHIETTDEIQKLLEKPVVEIIPRSREVGQSYITSVLSTMKAILYSFVLVLKHKPDLILVNGPGSCVPICVSGLLLRILGICDGRITFVESLCRVKSLSLTGKILYWFTDDFIVQWPDLKEKYSRCKYLGRLV